MTKTSLVPLMTAFLLASASGAFADDGAGVYNPKLGSFTLSKTDCVEMRDEVVDIWLDRVTVTFSFVNLTKTAQTVTIGFPVIGYPPERWGVGSSYDGEGPEPEKPDYSEGIEAYYDFKSTCDGAPLARKLVRTGADSSPQLEGYDYWFVATLEFKPGQTLEVTNSYRQQPDGFGDSMGNYGWSLRYVLTTGASWSGSIGKATIRFHSGDPGIGAGGSPFNFDSVLIEWGDYGFSYQPSQIKREAGGSVVTWVLEDFEPGWDLVIDYKYFHRPYAPGDLAWYLLREAGLLSGEVADIRSLYSSGLSDAELREWASSFAAGMGVREYLECLDEFYELAFAIRPDMSARAREFADYLANGIYAAHGYRFKDPRWTAVFSNFPWYAPRTDSVTDLSAREKKIIEGLKPYR